MRLTRRGAGTLVAAALLVALGLAAGHPLPLALGAIAVGAVVAAVLVAARRPRVDVHRELFRDRVERGGRAGITLRVHNPAARRQHGFTAVDRVGDFTLTVAVRSLAPGAEQSYLNELPTGRRGKHEVGPLSLRRADALGLSRSELFLGGTTTLWVYPRTHPVRSVAGGLPLHHHDGAATETSPRGSLDVREVREYVPGDEVRHLHWKATAKTGKLMIRDYADPHQPQFTVLLDNRREIPAEPGFEEAVELTASLVVAAAQEEHRCRLVASGGLDVGATPGSGAVRRFLDELCVVDRTARTGLPLVPAALAHGGGGMLVVVSPVAAPEDRSALAALRPRYVDVVVVALDSAAPQVPGVRVLRATDALDATLRWQTVVAR
ncbi:DUF58 domain-containing protein [Saccharothrix australiensis]|uniref:Uncharacterized protein (DUF58 family) n=1 Tax=Saccharothrix australiensis TaxID=2072 RepID=A0A495W228_9PSEU|nr:DUF58 domain-containing protein [Saccharothrix australiensis]RKT55741.1 uncharacterized protein (DUF58 family) [Saccharothrix australiensis]